MKFDEALKFLREADAAPGGAMGSADIVDKSVNDPSDPEAVFVPAKGMGKKKRKRNKHQLLKDIMDRTDEALKVTEGKLNHGENTTVADELEDYWTVKPIDQFDISEVDFKTLSKDVKKILKKAPSYTPEQAWGRDFSPRERLPFAGENLAVKDIVFFIKYQGKLYLVNTNAYSYAQEVTQIIGIRK